MSAHERPSDGDIAAAVQAIASRAAAEVAASAAATASTAVDVATEAAAQVAAKARAVAAAVTAEAASASASGIAPAQRAAPDRGPDPAAAAAAKVAASVAATATATAAAVLAAANVIRDQLARDAVAAADAVNAASSRPVPLPPPLAAARPATGNLVVGRPESAARVAADLRAGIPAGELRLHYQPIIAVATGATVSVEALVRWQHPVRGLLAAQEFIEVAERDSLVISLGEWVLNEACLAAGRLRARGDTELSVAVNLSARQLSSGDIVASVRRALSRTGCDAQRLVFELTETAPVTDMAVAVTSLRELKGLGAQLAIDDFGTGYASLQYLAALPVDILKIDQSFIAALGERPDDTSLVASVISLAHNVRAQCVAEGVETATQLAILEQLGCDFAQGYFFSRPLDETQLNTWLDSRPKATPRRPEVSAVGAVPQDGRHAAARHATRPADARQIGTGGT